MAELAEPCGAFHSPRRILAFVANGMFYAPDILDAFQESGAIVLPVNLSDFPTTGRLLTHTAPLLRQFEPDYALTFNHFGVDAGGAFLDFLHTARLPLASWFVDDPNLILHDYQNLFTPLTAAFATGLAGQRALRHRHPASFFLPLATSPQRFHPKAARQLPPRHPAAGRVTFVGTSWSARVREKRALGPFPARLARHFPALARAYLHDPLALPSSRLADIDPCAWALFHTLPAETAQAFDVTAAWLANRQSRAAHVLALAPLAPLVAGDPLWDRLFAGCGHPYAYLPHIHYLHELAAVYAGAAACIDIPSRHMQGALSQRLFDAPAAGCPVVAHAGGDLPSLFEPEREVLTYASPDELADQARRLLRDQDLRSRVSRAARRHTLARHTWAHRIAELDRVMGKLFG